MKEFPVYYRGSTHMVQVDDDDAVLLESVLVRGKSLSYVPAWKNRGFRPAIWLNGKLWYLSRWLLGVTDPKQIVDHIDQNPLNNQKSNLRLVGRRENAYNSGKFGWRKGSSKYRGVHCMGATLTRPWAIEKRYPDGRTFKEYFVTEEEAYQAREKWLAELMELLKVNFEAKGNRR